MKRFLHIALLVVLVACLSPMAFSTCVVIVASTTAPTDGGTPAGSAIITPNTSNTPAQLGFGSTNQVPSELLVIDNGLGTNCFLQNQKITITFNALMQNTSLDTTNFTVYDSNTSNGVVLSPSFASGFSGNAQATIFTVNVVRSGTPGNPTTGVSGSGFMLHNLKFDVSALAANANLTASVTSTVSSVVTPQPVAIGVIIQAGPVAISPASLDFSSQILGTTSSAQQVTVSNQGALPVIITGITASAGFSQQNSCGTTIAVNGLCTISVTFSPNSASSFTGTLTITDNTAASPHAVPLTGQGIPSPGVPVLTSVSPLSAISGGPGFTLTVLGSNFAHGSTVYWNNSARSTTFVSSGMLTAAIPASDLVAVGKVPITVVNGTDASSAVSFTVASNPSPTLPFLYSIPHIVQGGGFVTKLSFVNPSQIPTAVAITYLDQSGNLVSTFNSTISPAGTLRVSTPASARFGPSVTQWALVGSSGALAVNVFFEFTDSTGTQVLNTVGFNAPDPQTDFSAPVEFERTGTDFTRTVGMAFANPTDTSTNITLHLQDKFGSALANYSFGLLPFGQTAFTLSAIPQIANVLPSTNFVGSVSVHASQPVTAIALVDDLGPFAATPIVPGSSTLSVDQITAVCPTAIEVAKFNADLHLSFEFDPTAGTPLCRSAEASTNLTQLQLKVYQALRVMSRVAYDAPFPFTNKTLYNWLAGAVSTVRIRGDITTSFCCDSARSIDIAASLTSPFLQTNNWLGPFNASANAGVDTIVSTLVQLGRQSEGFLNTCGAKDNTIAEMSPWAVLMDLYDFNAQHSGTFLDDTTTGDPTARYRQVAASDAVAIVTGGNFCAASLNQVQPAGASDFGTTGVGDLPVRQTFAVSAGTATPQVYSQTSVSGSADFSIVSDTCTGVFMPPSCAVVVGYTPSAIGSGGATLTLGTAPVVTRTLTGNAIAPTPVPVAPNTYVLPHVIGGNGFVTKITVSNLVSINNDFVIRYVNQAGGISQTTSYTLQPGGSVRIILPDPSARFGAATTQWAIIGSRHPVNANLFFELADTSGKIVNTIGFNAAPALSAAVFPVEFERNPDLTFGRTGGLALANPNAFSVNYTLLLTDSAGNTMATSQGSLAAYAQTAIDLGTIAAFKAALPATNFVGSVRMVASGAIASIALQDDFGPFSATPPVALGQ